MEQFLIDKSCDGVKNLDSFMFGMLTDAFIGQPDESHYLQGVALAQNIANLVDTEDFYVLKVDGYIVSYVSVWESKIPMHLFEADNTTHQGFTTVTQYTAPEYRGMGYTERLLDYVVSLRRIEVVFCKWNNHRSRNLVFNQEYEYVGDFVSYGEQHSLYKTIHCAY